MSSDDGDSNLVWVGIGLGVFASMTGTIGKQMLRLSGVLEKQKLKYNAKVALTVGLLLNALVGPLVDMASYAFAPQSIIAPLAGLDVVWNTITAPCTLGEKLTYPVIFGVILIATGATGTSFFGNREDTAYTVELLKDKFARWEVAGYGIVLAVWLSFNIVFLQKRNLKPEEDIISQPSEISKDSSFMYVKGDLTDTIRGLSLGMTAGSIAGNMFCVKGFIELVQASIKEQNSSIWADWLPYVLLVGAVVFAVSNLFFLTKATREYEALFMGAVFEGTAIVCGAVSGVIVYSDLDALEWYQRIMYFVCLGAISTGVLIVAFNSPTDLQKDIDKQTQVITTAMQDLQKNKEEVIVEHVESHSSKEKSPHNMYPSSPRSKGVGMSPMAKHGGQVLFHLSLEDGGESPSKPTSPTQARIVEDETSKELASTPPPSQQQSTTVGADSPQRLEFDLEKQATAPEQAPSASDKAKLTLPIKSKKTGDQDKKADSEVTSGLTNPKAVALSKTCSEEEKPETPVAIEDAVKGPAPGASAGLACCSGW